MAQTKKSSEVSGTSKKTNITPTVAEIREWYSEYKQPIENYAKVKNNMKNLIDVTKPVTHSINTVDKDTIKEYFQNVSSNEKNLRNTVRYLYYRSNILFRLVNWYSSMWDLRCRKVIPKYDLLKENDKEKFLKSYNDTLDVLEIMNLQGNMVEVFQRVYLEDVCYCIVFYDDTGMIFYILDADECKIESQYTSGDYGFSIDMSKWRNAKKQKIIEFLGDPLQSMYNEYEKSGTKWVHCPDEYAACFKFRTDMIDFAVPPFSSMILQIANNEDSVDQQAVADALNVFKLIYYPMKTISGSKNPDDYAINPDIALEYFDRLLGTLPDYIAGAVVPGDGLETIDFKDNVSTDINKVEQSINQIFATSGGGAVLNANNIKTSSAFSAWLQEESAFAISTLLPQINAFTNRFLSYKVTNPAKVEHFALTIYTKKEFRESFLESCQYSYPNKIAYNTLLGFSEKDTLANMFLETEVLKLQDLMKFPLDSSYTKSSGDGEVGQGRDELPEDEIEPSTQRSRDA